MRTLTTLSSVSPTPLSTRIRLSITRRVCAATPSGSGVLSSFGSVGIWPVRNTQPSASAACEKGPTGVGAASTIVNLGSWLTSSPRFCSRIVHVSAPKLRACFRPCEDDAAYGYLLAPMLPYPLLVDAVLRMLSAMLIGCIIGIDRDLHGKPTGMKTLGLVSLGACIATMCAQGFSMTPTNDTGVSRAVQG